MVGIAEDTENALKMVIDAYVALQEHDPEHELLKLVELHEDRRGITPTREWVNRCIIDDDCWEEDGKEYYHRAIGYIRYFGALRDARRGLPYLLPPRDTIEGSPANILQF